MCLRERGILEDDKLLICQRISLLDALPVLESNMKMVPTTVEGPPKDARRRRRVREKKLDMN